MKLKELVFCLFLSLLWVCYAKNQNSTSRIFHEASTTRSISQQSLKNSILPKTSSIEIPVDKRVTSTTNTFFSNFSCFGVPSDSAFTCSGNGTCVSTDNCQCFVGYTGTNCESFFSNFSMGAYVVVYIIPAVIVVLVVLVFFLLLLSIGICIATCAPKLHTSRKETTNQSRQDSGGDQMQPPPRYLLGLLEHSPHYGTMFLTIGGCCGVAFIIFGAVPLIFGAVNMSNTAKASPNYNAYVGALSVGCIFVGLGLFAAVTMIPLYFSAIRFTSTGRFMRNISLVEGLQDYINDVKQKNPVITVSGKTWHFEKRKISARGQPTEKYNTKVITGNFHEEFRYNRCLDTSCVVNDNMLGYNIAKVKFTKEWLAGDKRTQDAYDCFVDSFVKMLKTKDKFYEHHVNLDIPSFKEKMLIVMDVSRIPFFLNVVWYNLISALLCGLWPYSFWLEYNSVRCHYKISKTIYA